MKHSALIILFFLTISFLSFSQKPNLKFEHIGTKEGLSQGNVICILQDSRGIMWFGTREGLNKYDGYKFTVYSHDNPNSNGIQALEEDALGNIWIASRGDGLQMLDREKDKIIDFNVNDSSKLSLALLHDSKGNLWVGTDKAGLALFDKKRKKFRYYVHNVNDPKSISNNTIHHVYEDSQHNLWVATQDGLNLMDQKSGTFTSFKHDEKNPKTIGEKGAGFIFEDSRKRFWVGGTGGLNLMDRTTGEFKRFRNEVGKNSISHNYVMVIEEDDNGYLWVGTQNGGLSLFDPERQTFYNYIQQPSNSTSLSDNSIYSLCKDSKGNMWIGTFSHGLDFISIDDNKFKHYKSTPGSNSLSNSSVLSFCEDTKGNLWISTDGGGVNFFDRKNEKFISYVHSDKDKKSIGGNYVLKIIEDSNENLWMGMWGDGITVFNRQKNTFKYYKGDPANPTSLTSSNIITLLEDSKKYIWVGSFTGGLQMYNPKENNFIRFNTIINNADTTGIDDTGINSIFEDSRGNLWIGTDGVGLCLLNKKGKYFSSFLHDENENSISSDNVLCIVEDSAKNLWIGTRKGLNNFDVKNKKFTIYHKRDGLPGEQITGILEDAHGNLWLSTNNGISRFNPKSKSFKNFSAVDGLQSEEFTRNAFLKSRTGAMYFGGPNGFNEFFPDSIKEKPYDPPLVLTDFQLFNKRVAISDNQHESILQKHIMETKEITLSYKESVMLFEFASLNYTSQEKKQYAYILEGFDEDWNYIGTAHTATYTNVDAGHYTFKVKGLDNEGNWSPNVIALSVTITPPFWLTWWFKLLGVIAIVASSAAFYKVRINSIEKQKRELEKQVTERTSEILQQQEELKAQAENMIEAHYEITAQGEKLNILYTEIKDNIRAAQTIQQSILPSEGLIRKNLPESFILYKPKDVVSGDFYWFDVKEDNIIIAAVDCTGHGVSGAFMSIAGHHILNQSIQSHKELVAAEILDRLNAGVIKELNIRADSQVEHGMDIALCIIDKERKKIQYAGANNPLYILRENEIIQIKANKFPIGLLPSGKVNKFTNNELEVKTGDIIYIFSDGYADQIGGADGTEKFKYPRFRELLVKIGSEDMDKQLSMLDNDLNNWRGSSAQLDDVLVIGFKI